MSKLRPFYLCVWSVRLLLVLTLASGILTSAQERTERTLDEIKSEALKRAQNGGYPLIGLDPGDVAEAFASIKTRDKDEWAAAFMAVADKYMAAAKSLESTDPSKSDANYVRAWRLYSFGRWPFPASPGKKRSYAKAI
jgi:esterase FrsA